MKQRAVAKGTNFTTSMRTLSRLRGQAAVEATLRALSGELGDVLRYGGLVPSGWYPASWYRDVWADITGSLEGLLSVCGAQEIRTRTVAGGNLEGFLDVEAQWT